MNDDGPGQQRGEITGADLAEAGSTPSSEAGVKGALQRIRAAAESDADLEKLPALRDFLHREATDALDAIRSPLPDDVTTDDGGLLVDDLGQFEFESTSIEAASRAFRDIFRQLAGRGSTSQVIATPWGRVEFHPPAPVQGGSPETDAHEGRKAPQEGYEPLDIEEVREEVEKIRASAGDDEGAHGAEDRLHRRVLNTIAEECSEPYYSALARAALETLEIDFARWCA